MTQYRQKTVLVEATQYDGTPEVAADIIALLAATTTPAFMGSEITNVSVIYPYGFPVDVLKVKTATGDVKVNSTDWVVQDVFGAATVCTDADFDLLYETIPV